jgi:putative hydrolase of the HAD superfamily
VEFLWQTQVYLSLNHLTESIMTPIKNILFDFGAVLFNIDFERVAEAFEEIGFANFQKQYTQTNASPLFDTLEKGKMEPEAFYDQIKTLSTQTPSNHDIENAWNAILLNYRKPSMQWIKANSDKYNMYLLSNTNIIHYNRFNNMAKEELGVDGLDLFFKKSYYSFQMGMRKPSAEIFQFVLNDAGILPQETLFIDDALPNIEAAQKLHFKTHHLLPGENIETLPFALSQNQI